MLSLGQVSDEPILGDYYIDFTEVVQSIEKGAYGPFDSSGVPQVDYDRWFRYHSRGQATSLGVQYTPVTIANYALGNLSLYRKGGDDGKLKLFLTMARWFVEHASITGDTAVWLHHWDEPYYGIKAPWISAMAQGMAISVLLRAHELTLADNFLSAAQRARKSFDVDVQDGGIRHVDANGCLWFEEYPNETPSHVLNGFIYSLFGLYDYCRVTREDTAFDLWRMSRGTLEQNLGRFSKWTWSRYDLGGKTLANFSYHELHILQLKILCKLTGSYIIRDYLERWQQSNSNPFIRILVRTRMLTDSLLNRIWSALGYA